ncbi:MAG TPA: ATP-binding protein [Blastocatellia bacterium]|nr:ATP-binding protein [Blastocatellia bacterium]
MIQQSFHPSRLNLKVKIVLFFAAFVSLLALSAIYFYSKTNESMEKELESASVSFAQNLALNPNIKLGLVNEDKKLLDSILGTIVKQRSMLYITVQSTASNFNYVKQGDNAQQFLEFYQQHHEAISKAPLVTAVRQRVGSVRFVNVRVPILRGRSETSSPDLLLPPSEQSPFDTQNEKERSQEQLGFIDVGVSYRTVDRGMKWLGWWSGVLLGLTLVTILAFILVIFRFVIKPVEAITHRANEIAEGNLLQQVVVRSNDEIGQLAFNFNLMAERLLENTNAREQYASQLAVLNSRLETANSQLQEQFVQVLTGKRQWEATFNAMSDAVFIFDADRRLIQVNNAGKILGDRWSAVLCKEDCCLIFPQGKPESTEGCSKDCSKCPLDEVFTANKRHSFERFGPYTNQYFLATVCPMPYGDGHHCGAIAVMRDITEEKMLRVQLLQSEKMSAVGQLVSGVAHELNNPLNSVIGYTQLCLENPQFHPDLAPFLECVVSEGLRARKIVQNLLTVSRQHKPEKKLVDLNDVIQLTIDLRAYEMRVSDIEILQEFESNLPLTMCDPHQLQQVFLNIIINAEQAMLAAHGTGRLVVRTLSTPEGKIQLQFIDNGPGIPADKLSRIFDPFFTTKDVGEGTGLGLSISYGIIKEHGGQIWAQSQQGGGATFIVELPVISASVVNKLDPKPTNAGNILQA